MSPAAFSSLKCRFVSMILTARLLISLSFLVAIATARTLDEYAGQIAQLDIQSLFLPGSATNEINETLIVELLKNNQVGSMFNSPSSSGNGPAPTAAWWRKLNQRLYDLSSQYGAKIPILFGLDSVHGAHYVFNATIFPQQIAVAATFDNQSAYDAGYITGLESRYAGVPWNFAPILDLATQASWARVYETYGEDPLLASRMGAATILGMQAPPPPEMNATFQHNVAACAKHYIGYSNSRTGRDRTPVWLPMNMLLQYFAPPFEAAIQDGKVLSIMENYIEMNGRPMVASEHILKFLLRTVMKFDGMLVTDYNEVWNLHDFHRAAASREDAVRIAMNQTTIDMIMTSSPFDFPDAAEVIKMWVKREELDRERIVKSAERVIALKRQVGLLDASPVPNPTGCVFACPENREKALMAARNSITLLQNDGTLPLSPASKNTVAVIGKACNSVGLMSGGWTVHWQGAPEKSAFGYGTTILEELRQRAPSMQFPFSEGCNVSEGSKCHPSFVDEALQIAEKADTVVVCVGEDLYAEKPGDIEDLTLPGEQIQLVERLAAKNSHIVIILIEGRQRILKTIPKLARAVIHGYYPGPAGGQAIAEVLLGLTNPSGRLPITYPSTPASLPLQYWRKANVYLGTDYNPQWPFGHGLSYTTFKYSDMTAEFSFQFAYFHVKVTVENTGERAARHSVLLFASQNYRTITPEAALLRDFTVIFLRPHESRTVELFASWRSMAYYDEFNCLHTDEGEVTFTVGDLTATASIPNSNDWSCDAWGREVMEHCHIHYVVPTGLPPSAPSSTTDYFISSVVCFGAGMVLTVIVVVVLRRRQLKRESDADVDSETPEPDAAYALASGK